MPRIPFLRPRPRRGRKTVLFHSTRSHRQQGTHMNISAKVIAYSISPEGLPLLTYELLYPRFIHSEFMTHRMVSKNSASSRAIPTHKLIEQVRHMPMMPIHWGLNQKGMQAEQEIDPADIAAAQNMWLCAARNAADMAEAMMDLGLHKQVVNRVLEPFVPMRVIATATEWNNFFHLRDHADAQPEIRALAQAMLAAKNEAHPQLLHPGQWHLPYITPKDTVQIHLLLKHGRITRDEPRASEVLELSIKVSVARCARVSYNNFEGRRSTVEEDIALYDKLVGSSPLHASPTEHQATPDEYMLHDGIGFSAGWQQEHLHGNLHGWVQYRKTLAGEFVPG